jgi:hypothetical protein
MSSKPTLFIAVVLAGLASGDFFAAPALAAKRTRTKSAGKAPAAAPIEAVARAGKRKSPRGKGSSSPGAALAPKDERDVTADVPAPTADRAPAPAATATASAGSPAKARVYTFGGLDVTGNLKAPQMLFFRGRVQQELDTSSPEKRSFLKELEKTADAKGL